MRWVPDLQLLMMSAQREQCTVQQRMRSAHVQWTYWLTFVFCRRKCSVITARHWCWWSSLCVV